MLERLIAKIVLEFEYRLPKRADASRLLAQLLLLLLNATVVQRVLEFGFQLPARIKTQEADKGSLLPHLDGPREHQLVRVDVKRRDLEPLGSDTLVQLSHRLRLIQPRNRLLGRRVQIVRKGIVARLVKNRIYCGAVPDGHHVLTATEVSLKVDLLERRVGDTKCEIVLDFVLLGLAADGIQGLPKRLGNKPLFELLDQVEVLGDLFLDDSVLRDLREATICGWGLCYCRWYIACVRSRFLPVACGSVLGHPTLLSLRHGLHSEAHTFLPGTINLIR